jgi:hypothetical protein
MPRWATALNFVIPTGADPDFLYRDTVHGDECGFLKESRTEFANATKVDRKFGVAQGRDLQFYSDRTQMPTSNPLTQPDSLRNPRASIQSTNYLHTKPGIFANLDSSG